MGRRYEPSEIEPKWVAAWEEEDLYRASDDPADDRPRFYALDMFPYPSGDLHMGHAEAFSGGDVVARYQAMRGHDVLHPIGWDAFGLPAENAAIKRGVEPSGWTSANIDQQAASFKRMGMSFDWSAAAAHLRPRVLPVDPVAVHPVLRARARVPEGITGQLVPDRRDGPGERAGDRGEV